MIKILTNIRSNKTWSCNYFCNTCVLPINTDNPTLENGKFNQALEVISYHFDTNYIILIGKNKKK